MSQTEQLKIAEELNKFQTDLETYRRDYQEYSNDRSIPLKEKTPILANLSKVISSTLERIMMLEERLNELRSSTSEQSKTSQ